MRDPDTAGLVSQDLEQVPRSALTATGKNPTGCVQAALQNASWRARCGLRVTTV